MLSTSGFVARGRIASVALVLAGLLSGCIPLIPEDKFLDVASSVAMAPEKTCDVLKVEFGLPTVTTVSYPDEIGLTFSEHRIPISETDTLRAWFLPAQEERGVVVLSYGAVGEMACYLLIANELVARGWSVAMYDYSGFGGSDGKQSLTALNRDGYAAIDWAREFSHHERVVLFGVSLGTIPSTAYAAEYPDRVAAIVIDGPISLAAEVESFSILLGLQPRRYAALFEPPLLIEHNLPRVTAPTLAFLYGQDPSVSATKIPAILSEAQAAVTWHEFTGLDHARGPYHAEHEYFAQLETFLAAVAADP